MGFLHPAKAARFRAAGGRQRRQPDAEGMKPTTPGRRSPADCPKRQAWDAPVRENQQPAESRNASGGRRAAVGRKEDS